MKALFIISLIFLSSIVQAQTIFIGQDIESIRNHWKAKGINSRFFSEGIFIKSDKTFFAVITGNPNCDDFIAAFDKYGNCISHSVKITESDTIEIKDMLKSQGFEYRDDTKEWYKDKVKCKIIYTSNSCVVGTTYIFECQKYEQ